MPNAHKKVSCIIDLHDRSGQHGWTINLMSMAVLSELPADWQ